MKKTVCMAALATVLGLGFVFRVLRRDRLCFGGVKEPALTFSHFFERGKL